MTIKPNIKYISSQSQRVTLSTQYIKRLQQYSNPFFSSGQRRNTMANDLQIDNHSASILADEQTIKMSSSDDKAPKKGFFSRQTKAEKLDAEMKLLKEKFDVEIKRLMEKEGRKLTEKNKIQSVIDKINENIKTELNPKKIKTLKKELKRKVISLSEVESSLKRVKIGKEILTQPSSCVSIQMESSDDNLAALADQQTINIMSVHTTINREESVSLNHQMITTEETVISPVTEEESVVDQQQTRNTSANNEKTATTNEVKIPSILSQLNQNSLGGVNSFSYQEKGFIDTVKDADFKVYPVIVRANGREKKVLALENAILGSSMIQFSKKLFEELNMTDRIVYSVTISSLDDRQTIPVEFDKAKLEGFYCPDISKSYYHNEAERLWPHLFGPGQLSREEETVHIQLTHRMANALECSALTTAEVCKMLTRCNYCKRYRQSTSFPERGGKTSDPKNDYYWLMDRHSYNIMRNCEHRRGRIRLQYYNRIVKRSKFIESKEYLKVAEKKVKTSFWSICWDLFCGCIPKKKYGK